MNRKYSKSELTLAAKLTEGGIEVDEGIHNNILSLLRQFHQASYMNLVAANALTWTGHAVPRTGYYPQALRFLEKGTMTELDNVAKFAGRFGKENLATSLQGWREIICHSEIPDLPRCNLMNVKLFQDQCLRIAERLMKQGALHGVGPWLFCAPFKIIVAHRDSFWDDPAVDDILMPLGVEVIRGMKLLIKNHSPFVLGIDTAMITEEEGGLFEGGLGTFSLVQSVCREIGRISNSRVIHINSGLFLYGKNELE